MHIFIFQTNKLWVHGISWFQILLKSVLNLLNSQCSFLLFLDYESFDFGYFLHLKKNQWFFPLGFKSVRLLLEATRVSLKLCTGSFYTFFLSIGTFYLFCIVWYQNYCELHIYCCGNSRILLHFWKIGRICMFMRKMPYFHVFLPTKNPIFCLKKILDFRPPQISPHLSNFFYLTIKFIFYVLYKIYETGCVLKQFHQKNPKIPLVDLFYFVVVWFYPIRILHQFIE